MENLQISTSNLTNHGSATHLSKAWHLVSILLTLRRPATVAELAAKCILFKASPDYVEFLCFVDNSPLFLMESGCVSISAVVFVTVGEFVSRCGFGIGIGVGVGGGWREVVDVRSLYCRKQKRGGAEVWGLKRRRSVSWFVNGNDEENQVWTRDRDHKISVKEFSTSKPYPKFPSFLVEEEEGSGGYGTVYRVRRTSDGTTFAIKFVILGPWALFIKHIINPHSNAHKNHVNNELKMLERFGGRNFVIKYEGSVKSGSSDCFVLQYVEHDRPEVLKKEIDVHQLQWYGYCMFKALASLHKQEVVHRDVKPGNFLFSRKYCKGFLIDFNLAKDLGQKYEDTDRSKAIHSNFFERVPTPNSKLISPSKQRKILSGKFHDSLNGGVIQNFKSTTESKILKKKVVEKKTKSRDGLAHRNSFGSQGADGSGLTSAKDATSTRTPSVDRLKEPLPSIGRKELINLAQAAMESPNQEAAFVPTSKRKRAAALPGNMNKKPVYFTSMLLHSSGIPVCGSSLLKRGEGRPQKEGACVGTKGFRAPEVLLRSSHQGPKVDIWSAGVTLLYLMTGKLVFNGDPEQNMKEIVKLRGSEDLWEVAKLHNRESSFPMDLFDVKFLPSTKLLDWCKANTKRKDFLETVPSSAFDLIDKCLTVNPRLRITAEEALQHDFFASCH